MEQEFSAVPSIGNLNDGIAEFEGKLKSIKEFEPDKEQAIQRLVKKIDQLKKNKGQAFF